VWSYFTKAGSLGGVLGKGEIIEGKKFLGDEQHYTWSWGKILELRDIARIS
jgi:hypothetical protein